MTTAWTRHGRAVAAASPGTGSDRLHTTRVSSHRGRGRTWRVVFGVAVVAGALWGTTSTGAQAAVQAHLSFAEARLAAGRQVKS